MKKFEIKKDLFYIADYVKEYTGLDIRSNLKTKETLWQDALYLFYILADEHTKATHKDISEVCGRSRSSVAQGIQRKSDYVKKHYESLYKLFNPFKIDLKGSPFSDTVDILYKAKKQLELNIEDIEERGRLSSEVIRKQVKNEKVFKIIQLVKELDNNTLDIIITRLPPIIKMARV